MLRLSRPIIQSSNFSPRAALSMANATTGFAGAATGVGSQSDPAPGDLRHSSGLDNMGDVRPPAQPRGGNGSGALEERSPRRTEKSPFTYERALYVNPPPTAAFLPDGRPNPNAKDSKDANGNQLMPRRWSREANELCVEHTIRTKKHLTDYIQTYRWSDPHWRPILSLPVGNPIALELRARHCNYSLKYIAQKGHATYNIQHVQHSVLHPNGIAERAYVETSVPKGERLLTNIIHEGVLDAKDHGNINAPRGVVAISQVQGFSNAFHRRPNLWQRSRRIGALQSEMGAIDWELHGPEEVGRLSNTEVMLLAPHTRFLGGGMSTMAIVSSLNMAQHPFHYVAEFEAPASTITDAIHQCAHLLARHNKLIKPDGSEKLHMLGSLMKTGYPFSPIELDLHFKIQMSQPVPMRNKEEYPSSLIGTPLLDGGVCFMSEFMVTQGVDNYTYDEMASARPAQWWQQGSTLPYAGNVYFCRSGQLKHMSIFEDIANPFEELTSQGRMRRSRRRGGLTNNGNERPADSGPADGDMGAEGIDAAFHKTTSTQMPDEELLSTSAEVGATVKRFYDKATGGNVSSTVPPNDRARQRMRRMAKSLQRHE